MLSETLTCTDFVDDLAAADELHLLADPARTHAETCLRCQAELASYRRMRRALRSLADHPFPVDPELHVDVLIALDEEDGRLIGRVPAVSAATIGGIAAAASVIAFAARHRRMARLAS